MTDSAHHCADTPLDHLRFHESETSQRIRGLVGAVDRDNAFIGVLSTGSNAPSLSFWTDRT